MSVAAAQAQQFYEQVARDRAVFTFVANDSFLVFRIRGDDVVPFWSSRSRMERVLEAHPKYRPHQVDEIALADFLGETLPQLHAERIRVGVNWSGEQLTGYDLKVDELRRNLDHWLAKQSD